MSQIRSFGDISGNHNFVGNEIHNSQIHIHGPQEQDPEAPVSVQSDRGQRILEWLFSTKSKSKEKDALEAYQTGTCDWFFQHEDVRKLIDGSNDILWCKGNAGTGKTTLMALALQRLEALEEEDKFVGSIFFDRMEHDRVSLRLLVAELVGQCISAGTVVPKRVEKEWVFRHKHGGLPPLAQLREWLFDLIQAFKLAFFVCDALDECPTQTRRQFIFFICNLQTSCPSLRIIASSRDLEIIGKDTPLERAAVVAVRAHSADLEIYLNNQVELKENLWVLRENPSLYRSWKDSLIEHADGMFLVVSQYVELLDRQNPQSYNDFEDSLVLLAKTPLPKLEYIYTATWQHIQVEGASQRSSPYAAMGHVVMLLICFSERTLHIRELQQALALYNTKGNIYDSRWESSDDRILGSCLGLVKVIEGTVRFVHETIDSFFATYLTRYLEQAHTIWGTICLRCLALRDLGDCQNFYAVDSASRDYPLLYYAIVALGDHIECSNYLLNGPLVPRFLEDAHLSTRTLRAAIYRRIGYAAVPNEVSNAQKLLERASGIHLAAYYGFLERLWMPHYCVLGIDAPDSNGWTALRWAAYGGRASTVDFLISEGSDVAYRDKDGSTTLIWALGTWSEVSTYLADIKGSGTAKIHLGRRYAILPNHVRPRSLVPTNCPDDVIRLLIERTGNLDMCDGNGLSALHHAAHNHQFGYIKKLIHHGAAVNSADSGGHPALLYALSYPRAGNLYGHLQVLDNCVAVCGDVIDVLEGSDLESDTTMGNMLAPEEGEEDVLVLLSQDFGSATNDAGACLNLAAAQGYTRVVRLLLTRGVDPNFPYSGHETPLMLACRNVLPCHHIYGDTQVMPKGRVYQGDPVLRSSQITNTRVAQSLRDFYLDKYETCKALLEYGADPNMRNDDGKTAYDIAADYSFRKICSLLDSERFKRTHFKEDDILDLDDEYLERYCGRLVKGILYNTSPLGCAFSQLFSVREIQWDGMRRLPTDRVEARLTLLYWPDGVWPVQKGTTRKDWSYHHTFQYNNAPFSPSVT